MDRPVYFTTDEAAKYLKVTRRTVYRYITDGKLEATKTAGGGWRVSDTALIKFLGEETDMGELEHIKVNLPPSMDAYERGGGEGVWVLVDKKTKAAHDADADGGMYEGILDNDSWYYPGLDHGTKIPFEMRGDKRPVTPFSWLYENYGESHERETVEEIAAYKRRHGE